VRQFKIKKIITEYRLPVILISVGIVLMVIASVLSARSDGGNDAPRDKTEKGTSQGTVSTVKNDFELYADYEERRLSSILSQIEGAGKVQAVVYVGATPSDDGSGLLFPEIKGVLIYAEGAARASIKEKIIRAVAVLYSLSVSDISVLS